MRRTGSVEFLMMKRITKRNGCQKKMRCEESRDGFVVDSTVFNV